MVEETNAIDKTGIVTEENTESAVEGGEGNAATSIDEEIAATKVTEIVTIQERRKTEKIAVPTAASATPAEKAVKMNSRNAEKAFSCDFCEKTFVSVQDLKRHEEKKHNNGSGSPIPQMDGEDDSCLNYSFKSEPPTTPSLGSSIARPPCTPTRGSHPSTSTSQPCPCDLTIEEMKAAIREAFK